MTVAARAVPTDDQLDFGVLGSLVIERNGSAVDCGGLKQRAVLALLLVNANQAVSVDRMVDELWGEDPPPAAVATLQAYVSNLRKSLEPGRRARTPATVLLSRAGSYELAVDPDRVDALRFERLAVAGAGLVEEDPETARSVLTGALELWRGPALHEFATYQFAVAEIARLDELHITAREHRIEADLSGTGGSHLVAELERLIGDHPLRERLWGQLMRAYYRSGRQAESLRAFRRCERVLAEELGISPSCELRALEQAVLEQDHALLRPRPRDRTEAATVQAPAGIVGRAAELRALEVAIDGAERGHGTVLLIDGEPGVGKSRLLEAMRQRSADRQCAVGLARCVEVGGTPPFWPWAQLVRGLGAAAVLESAGPHAPSLRSLVPSSTPAAVEDVGPGLHRYRVADGLLAALGELGTERPVVLLIDDLYCADPDSLSVMALVGAGLADHPVVLVGTHRTGGSRSRSVTEALAQLSRCGWCRRLHLARFDRSEVDALVRRIAGEQVDGDRIDAIHERTEGNAFFTVELARLLVDDAGIGTDPAAIPDTVRDVIDLRLEALSPTALTMVRAAALIGRTFDLTVVAEVADVPLAEAMELADAAVVEGIAHEARPSGHYRFTHVLMIDAIVGRIGALRRAELHDRIASALERRFAGDDERWHEIAHHRLEATPITGAEPAIEALATAGRRAAAVDALELADQLLARRHELVLQAPPTPERDRAELESLLDRSVVWTWRHGYQSEDMLRAADRMAELTRGATPEAMLDPSSETGVRHGVLPALQARCSFEIVAGNVVASERIADSMVTLAEASPHPYVVAVAHTNAMVAALHQGRIADALDHGGRCAEVLPAVDPDLEGAVHLPLGQQSLTVTYLAFEGWAQRMADRRDEATMTLLQGRMVADRSGHAFSRAFHAALECIVGAVDGSPGWVAEVLEWEGRHAGEERFQFLDASLELYRRWAVGMTADPGTAADGVRSVLEELQRAGAMVVQTLHWSMVAELELLAGRPRRAVAAAEAGIARSARCGERFWLVELERLAAAAFDELGETARRDDALDRADRLAAASAVAAYRPRRPLVAAG